MRQFPGRALWLGRADDLRDARAILDAGIAAVVELADGEMPAALPRELIRCRFALSDGGGNPPWLLRMAAETVASLLRAGEPVLVCCSAGLSRSVCVAACGGGPAAGRVVIIGGRVGAGGRVTGVVVAIPRSAELSPIRCVVWVRTVE